MSECLDKKIVVIAGPNGAGKTTSRVAQGGHAIPEAVIRRRFDVGWRNFVGMYRSLVDVWQVYDNSGEEPILLEEGP